VVSQSAVTAAVKAVDAIRLQVILRTMLSGAVSSEESRKIVRCKAGLWFVAGSSGVYSVGRMMTPGLVENEVPTGNADVRAGYHNVQLDVRDCASELSIKVTFAQLFEVNFTE
jgi:hypothetical protein